MGSSVRVIFKARQMLMQLKERYALKIVSRTICFIKLLDTFFNTRLVSSVRVIFKARQILMEFKEKLYFKNCIENHLFYKASRYIF